VVLAAAVLDVDMKSYLQNLDIECWRYAGRLGINDPTICVSILDSKSCDPLLLAIDEIESTGSPAKRTITFRPCERRRSVSRLRLLLSPDSESLRQMHISVDGGAVTMEMTMAGLELLRNALISWRDGGEDFGLSPTWNRSKRRELGTKDLASGELWFWGPSMDP
jgi:hypothetical protein